MINKTKLTIKQSESSFQQQVIDLAQLSGWMVHAERPAWSAKGYRTPIQGNAGWPDLVLAHPGKGRIIMAELKSEKGKTSPEQTDWLNCFDACGIETHIWRPSDFEEIVRILRA